MAAERSENHKELVRRIIHNVNRIETVNGGAITQSASISVPNRANKPPGPNEPKIGHLGQVSALCLFLYQTLHSATDRYLHHFKFKKLSQCHIVTSYLIRHKNVSYRFSNFKPLNASFKRA